MKKLITQLLLVIFGGFISVGIYKSLETPDLPAVPVVQLVSSNGSSNYTPNANTLYTPHPTTTTSATAYTANSKPKTNRTANAAITMGAVDFTHVADITTPAVVHIKTQTTTNSRRSIFSNTDDRELTSGSGVIIAADGYIVTNKHVIDGASTIQVILQDKRTYSAKLIGADPQTDLAVIKIAERSLPYIPFGDSDQLRVGEWVVAVGNPFSLSSTVTSGIVSAKGRNINILSRDSELAIESFIQTDAVVNPGNSGGALVNLRGELVGINTAIATPTGYYSGYAFAVPANLAQKITSDFIKYGKVKRGFLGVGIQSVDAKVAQNLQLERVRGVMVTFVNAKSAADLAGIRANDVIIQVNQRAVNSSSELQEAVSLYHPGDKIMITVIRNGKIGKVDVELQDSY